jgi:hypothetical protein
MTPRSEASSPKGQPVTRAPDYFIKKVRLADGGRRCQDAGVMGLVRRVVATLVRSGAGRDVPPVYPELRVMAYQQADLMRHGELTRDQAMDAIARQFPDLSRRHVAQALAQGLFESR